MKTSVQRQSEIKQVEHLVMQRRDGFVPSYIAQQDLRQQQKHQIQLQTVARGSVATAQLFEKTFAMKQAARTAQLPQLRNVQRVEDEEGIEENQSLQTKLVSTAPTQRIETSGANNTGLPNQLKAGIESLSGMSMDHVKVHYNSDKPAQLQAHAYAQGSEIHLAPGQEQHLPHEAWHVVQQAQRRVNPTMQMAGTAINDDQGLEHEADVMGAKALTHRQPAVSAGNTQSGQMSSQLSGNFAQRLAIPSAGNSNLLVQRAINSAGFERTADLAPNYLVNPAARQLLYSDQAAPPPAPEGLYFRLNERDNRAPGRDLYAWRPNVKLLNNREKAIDFKGNKMIYQEDGKDKELDLATLKLNIETPIDAAAGQLPTLGMLGKNDCAAFAKALYAVIARAGYVEIDEDEVVETTANYVDNYPQMEIGDLMKHNFVGGRCPYHGATVVAKQNDVLVTLEAHVSKDLSTPDFHIRNGAQGFVDDNNQGKDMGPSLDVWKYTSGPPDDKDQRDYGKFSGGDNNSMYILKGNVGSTPTTAATPGRRALYQTIHGQISAILNDPKSQTFWKTKTIAGFSEPDGIPEIRQLIGSNFMRALALATAKAPGAKPWNRDQDTHDFYVELKKLLAFIQVPVAGDAPLNLVTAKLGTILVKVQATP